MSVFDCCCGGQKYIIFITGHKKDKDMFLEKMFGIRAKDISFSEYEVRYKCSNLIIQMLENDEDLKEVYDMHTKMANGVVFLRDNDIPVKTNKKALFVYLSGKSKQESEGNIIVSSIEDSSYADCKQGFNKLISKIKSE